MLHVNVICALLQRQSRNFRADPRDGIVAAFAVYGPGALVNAPFVLSLRHVGYTGVVMLAVNANVSEEDLAFMERLKVSLYQYQVQLIVRCVRDIISQQASLRARASAVSDAPDAAASQNSGQVARS
jgi:hypothetical protein